jgi:molybdenum cofactor cytidylyltransferase
VIRTFAIIPAAGKSQRMGMPKLTLPLGGSTIIEHTMRSLAKAKVEEILVVVGPTSPELTKLTESSSTHVLRLEKETHDMRATVMAGLRHLDESQHPRPDDRVLLIPADHPTLDPEIVEQLQAARTASTWPTIIIPTFKGNRGHPVLFDWQHVANISNWPTELGLNSYFRTQLHVALEVPVDKPSILIDLDTPEDYARLLREYNVVSGER